MTAAPLTVSPCVTVQEAMQLMSDNRVRHLPVVDNGKIYGMLSLGDLVNWIISVQDDTIEHLQHYITGQYPC
jgi:CBS domain-containing protein